MPSPGRGRGADSAEGGEGEGQVLCEEGDGRAEFSRRGSPGGCRGERCDGGGQHVHRHRGGRARRGSDGCRAVRLARCRMQWDPVSAGLEARAGLSRCIVAHQGALCSRCQQDPFWCPGLWLLLSVPLMGSLFPRSHPRACSSWGLASLHPGGWIAQALMLGGQGCGC